MPHPRLAAALGLVAACLVAARAADPDPAALAERFAAERAAAAKAGFPAGRLAPADDLAAKAAAAAKAGNARNAARYYRDARWQLPYLPANLPPHVARVLGESRVRHPARVNALAYRPDGGALASASKDRTVRVWDLETGRELAAYRGHAAGPDAESDVLKVGGVAFAPDGKTVASVGVNRLHIWDAATGKGIRVVAVTEKEDRPLKSVAFAPDGKGVAVGGDDGILRVFDPATGKETFKSASRNARIERLAFSPNGKLIGAADNLGKVGVYAPGQPNPMPLSIEVVDRGGPCLGVGFAADGSGVFTAGADNKARLSAGPKADGSAPPPAIQTLREYPGHTDTVTDLAMTADGTTLVTGGGANDRTVRVWEAGTGKQVRLFQGHLAEVTAVAVRADGRQAASAAADGSIRLWDLSAADDHRPLAGAGGPVWAVAVTADGKTAAVAGADATIRLYDPETGAAAGELKGHASAVTALAFLPNGALASAGGDRVVKVWDVKAKAVAKELAGHDLPVLALAASTDGALLASAAADRTVRGWEPAAGKARWAWAGKSAACGVAVRAGGKQVAVGTADGNLTVLDVSGAEPKELWGGNAHTAGVAAVAYAPDGATLATAGGDGALQLWAVDDAGVPKAGHRFDAPPRPGGGFSPLSAVAFTPDGRFVAAAGADAVVRVFDAQTKAEVRGLRGHAEWATALAFGPGGRLLVSGGADRKGLAFELTPQEGAAPVGHLSQLYAVAVSPDGKTAATASKDKTVKLWDVATGREIDTLAGPTDDPFAVAFLGNDRVVVGGVTSARASGQLHIWKGKPGRLAASVTPAGEVYTLAALADGSKFAAWTARAVAGDTKKANTYEVYDADGKQLAAVPDPVLGVQAVAFAPDLSLAAAGDDSGTVRLWNLATKERAGGDWPLLADAVADVGLSPDKALLVAADVKGQLKVADVAKRAVRAAADGGKVRAVVVSPTGDTFLTLGPDGVTAWPLSPTLTELKPLRTWPLPVDVAAAAYTPDGKAAVTANADGTAFVLTLP